MLSANPSVSEMTKAVKEIANENGNVRLNLHNGRNAEVTRFSIDRNGDLRVHLYSQYRRTDEDWDEKASDFFRNGDFIHQHYDGEGTSYITQDFKDRVKEALRKKYNNR